VKGYATDSSKPADSYKFAPHFARNLQEVNNALTIHYQIIFQSQLTFLLTTASQSESTLTHFEHAGLIEHLP
jgi:hypothetical protein